MIELLTNGIFSWGVLFAVLLVFGFAPRFVLRLAVLCFERDDPRRAEMLAELHAVPRMERPLWVAEQLEVAMSEGLWERITWALTGRVIHRWHLGSGVKAHRRYPRTFWIPSDWEKTQIGPGDHVKLMFEMRDGWGERMWVDVTAVGTKWIRGELINSPVGIPRLHPGRRIRFTREHVIDVIPEEEVIKRAVERQFEIETSKAGELPS